jgi:type VI secretion system protein VasJ
MLLAPPPEILAGVDALLDKGAFREALESAEDQAGVWIFWLDLHRASARALEGLGLGACEAALLCRARALCAAFPEIPGLAFEDGTPFASRGTREWLAPPGGGEGGAAPSGAALYGRYLEGDPARALSDLGDPAARPRTGRERLAARAVEMRLYLRTGRPVEAAALARWAVAECGRLDLASYDPETASGAMEAAALALRGAGPGFRDDYLKALGILAQCGPRAATALPPAGAE